MDNKKILRRTYDKKFQEFKQNLKIQIPPQGWIKTLREFLGMTTSQFAKKIGVTQPRVINIEKNEKNLKISTMEKIADSLNCEFVYMLVPREKIDDILYKKARQKALKILNKVNQNMQLEDQLAKTDELLEDLIEELLDGNLARIWDEG